MLRYAISDGSFPDRADDPRRVECVARCVALAAEGVEFLLIREKQMPAGALTELVREVLTAVRKAGGRTRVLVARRGDVAICAGADGVHLSGAAGELTVEQVHEVWRRAGASPPFVSVSCHRLEEVERARADGASAVLFAPVFGKRVDGVEVVAGLGLEQLAQACRVAGAMPVFALGGVNHENARDCMEAGAAGIAGIRMFFP